MAAGDQRQHDVFQDRQIGDKIKTLENESQILPAKVSPTVRRHGINIQIIHPILTGSGGIQGPEKGKKGRFSRSRFPHNGHKLPGLKLDVDILDRQDGPIPFTILLISVLIFCTILAF
jgi:hypothetical protein